MSAWTLTDAATEWVRADGSSVSRRTLQREHKRGKFPNATQADNGAWSIPADDLAGAGYKLAAHHTDDSADFADAYAREGLLERLERESEIARLEIASTLQADAHATEVERLKNDLAVERKRTTDEVNRVTKERDQAASDAEHHRTEVERLKVDLAKATAELTGANRLVDELRASRDAADRRAESAADDLDQIQQQLAEARANARWRYRRQLRQPE